MRSSVDTRFKTNLHSPTTNLTVPKRSVLLSNQNF